VFAFFEAQPGAPPTSYYSRTNVLLAVVAGAATSSAEHNNKHRLERTKEVQRGDLAGQSKETSTQVNLARQLHRANGVLKNIKSRQGFWCADRNALTMRTISITWDSWVMICPNTSPSTSTSGDMLLSCCCAATAIDRADSNCPFNARNT